jgi:hypothetical protein
MIPPALAITLIALGIGIVALFVSKLLSYMNIPLGDAIVRGLFFIQLVAVSVGLGSAMIWIWL